MTANSKRNVSTTRGVKGGYVFRAPVGTAGAPTAQTFRTWGQSVPSGFENLGYIPEDGFTEGVSLDSGTVLRDINLDTLDETTGPATETVTFALMEMKAAALAVQYGSENVSDANGTLEVRHRWANLEEHCQYVFLLLLKNGRIWVKYVPDGKVTEVGDFTGNKTTAAQREVTVTYNDDESGVGCYDWIESTETPAPRLSSMSLTGGTLSPTFAADTRSYTATATGSSVTLSASAAAGNTVAVRCGENSYSSGASIPVVVGTNKIVVTVTNTASGAQGVYVLTVTKS